MQIITNNGKTYNYKVTKIYKHQPNKWNNGRFGKYDLLLTTCSDYSGKYIDCVVCKAVGKNYNTESQKKPDFEYKVSDNASIFGSEKEYAHLMIDYKGQRRDISILRTLTKTIDTGIGIKIKVTKGKITGLWVDGVKRNDVLNSKYRKEAHEDFIFVDKILEKMAKDENRKG